MSINWFDVTTYGAVGDGSTDDTTAIQNAINAAGDGNVVFFPAGKLYKTSSTLSVAYDNHTWLMYGASLWPNFNGVGVRFGSFTASKQNNSVYGGSIYRKGSIAGGVDWTAGNIGWQWLNVSRYYHVDYYIHGFEIGQQLLGEGTDAGSFTVTIASPAVFTKTAHGLVAGSIVYFTTTGALPTGLSVNTPYYVISAGLTANNFEVSSTPGGAAINTSGTQSGTHTLWNGATFGIQYGHLAPRHIVSNKYGVYCTCRNGGWCNENAFFGAGRIGTVSSDPSATGGYMIYLSRDVRTPHVLNNNKFYGVCLENGKSSNKPGAVYCDAGYTLFDYLRYEGFDTPFITTSGSDYASVGGNIFRGGIGLSSPATCLSNPTAGANFFTGLNASVHCGASATERALAIRDVNSGNNYSFSVQNTGGTDVFLINGVGKTQIGSGADRSAKLGVINDSASQKGVVIYQQANATVPAFEVQQSTGAAVAMLQKNTNGSATENEMVLFVGTPGTRLTTGVAGDAQSIVAARGASGGVFAFSTATGIAGVVGGGNDDGSVASAGKQLVTFAVGGNASTSNLDATLVMEVTADGTWSNASGLVAPTRLKLFTGSTAADTLNTVFEADSANKIGFFSASPVAKPTVTGSRGGNAALASLLTALANLGLVTDSSS